MMELKMEDTVHPDLKNTSRDMLMKILQHRNLSQQTGSQQRMDLKRGDRVQLCQIMLWTKYQNNPTYTSGEIFAENRCRYRQGKNLMPL